MISSWIQSSAVSAGGINVLNGPSITGNTNDYPAGALSASIPNIVRISSTGAYNLTGVAGGSGGMLLSLINVGSNQITLKSQTGSIAANQFLISGGDDELMEADAVVNFFYDSTTSRWRRISWG